MSGWFGNTPTGGGGGAAPTVSAADITDASAVGRGVLTAADEAAGLDAIGGAAASHAHSAADITSGTLAVARGGTGGTTAAEARTAIGAAAAAPTTYSAADFTLVAGGGSDTATLVSGKVRFALTGSAARYYSATTRDAPRARLAIPSTATRAILIARVATLTTPGTSYDSLGVFIRGGSDETAAPPARVQVSATYAHRLPSVVHFRDGSNNVYTGDAVSLSYGATVPFTGQTWNGTRWIAVQWDARTGQTHSGLYVGASAPTDPAQFAWTTLNESSPSSLGYGSPTWMVVTGMQPGGSPAAMQLDADVIAWVWS